MGLPQRGVQGQVLQIRPFPVISGIEEAPAEGRIIGVNGIDFSVLRFRLAIKPLTPVFSSLAFSPWLFATWSRYGRTGGRGW